MVCSGCGWGNPPHFTHCHHCKALLSGPVAGVGEVWIPASAMRAASAFQGLLVLVVDLAFALLIFALSLAAYWLLRKAVALSGHDVLLQLIGFMIVAWLVLPLMDRGLPGTPGKRLLGLHLVRADGRPAGFWRALLRTVVMHLTHAVLPVVMLMLEALVLRRPLHDRVSGLHLVQPEEYRLQVLRAAQARRKRRASAWSVPGWLLLTPVLLALLAVLVDLLFLNPGVFA